MEVWSSVVDIATSWALPVPCQYPLGDALEMFSNPSKKPMALLVGAMGMYGSDHPWEIPYNLSVRLGIECLDAKSIKDVGENGLRRALCGRPALHVSPPKMGTWISRAADFVVGQYDGDPALIWNRGSGIEAQRLIRRLVDVPGIGNVKALAFTFLLGRDWDVDINEWDRVDIESNSDINRVLIRLGIVNPPRPIDPKTVVAIWEGLRRIGKTYCVLDNPRCAECPMIGCRKKGV